MPGNARKRHKKGLSASVPIKRRKGGKNLALWRERKIAGSAWKKKREAEAASREVTTSFWSPDGSTTCSAQDSDCDASTSGRGYVETAIKQEGVKEELILEDYGSPDDSMEYQSPEQAQRIKDTKEDTGVVHSLPTEGAPFETIICGSEDVKIKQEIFEDESDAFSGSHEVETVPTWSVPTVKESSQPASNKIPQSALKPNFDSPNFSSLTTIKVQSPINKSVKQISKAKVKTSGKIQKDAPALRFENCKICVNEIFCSSSDLMEHYILKHSDASSTIFPSGAPPGQQPFRVAIIPDLSGSATPGSSGVNATPVSSPGLSCTTSGSHAPSLSAADMQGQPPHNVIPPYISACDVFDGVYISLKNVPSENRKITREKLVELVKFICNGNADPALISFSLMEK